MDKLKNELTKKGYDVKIFETKQEASLYLCSEIKLTTVGIGGSVSVAELGIYPILKESNTVYWHGDKEQVARLGDKAIRQFASTTKIYISSVNAITSDGVIINIDYTGNRIASMCYGHEKVYLIVGKNKIAGNFEKALWRARNIASPKNAMRLERKTPCAIKGDKCYDCNSPERICNGFLVFDRAMAGTKTEILLINEELGY